MFELSRVDVSNLWFDIELAEIAELLVFHDQVEIVMPYGRFHRLLNNEPADVQALRILMEEGRLRITIDDFPLGEVALELGLIRGELAREGISVLKRAAFDQQSLHAALKEHIRTADIPPLGGGARNRGEWEKMRPFLNIKYLNAGLAVDVLVNRARAMTALLADQDFLQRSFASYQQARGKRAELETLTVEPLEVDAGLFHILNTDALGTANLLQYTSAIEFMLRENEADDAESFITPSIDTWIEELGRGFIDRVRPGEQIEAFQRYNFGKARISNAIRSGQKRFADILPIIENREPLGAMVRNKPRSKELLRVYIENLQEADFLEKPIGKTSRWLTMSAIGGAVGFAVGGPIAGGLAGAGLGAVDTFLVDKIGKKPSAARFVNGDLRGFVSDANQP